jgi:restriction system protein
MIPDFQSIMLPMLEILSDEKEHKLQDLKDKICTHFKLTEEEKASLLPKSNQSTITNRVSWARIYLIKSGLIQNISRGVFKITQKGKEILQTKPTSINIGFLKTLPDFKNWQNTFGRNQKVENTENDEINIQKTPEELLEYSFSKLREELAQELIEKIKYSSPAFFENLVIDLLLKMGYGGSKQDAGQVIGKSGDGGIDGIIKEDKLGLDTIYIQAKRWENIVPVSAVRDFAGSLLSKKAKKGIFISTSYYPKSAYEFVSSIEPKIVLINGNQLTDLLIDNNVGISVKNTFEIKKIDLDYFDEQ